MFLTVFGMLSERGSRKEGAFALGTAMHILTAASNRESISSI